VTEMTFSQTNFSLLNFSVCYFDRERSEQPGHGNLSLTIIGVIKFIHCELQFTRGWRGATTGGGDLKTRRKAKKKKLFHLLLES